MKRKPKNSREAELRRMAEPWIVEAGEEAEPERRRFIETFIESSRPRPYDGDTENEGEA